MDPVGGFIISVLVLLLTEYQGTAGQCLGLTEQLNSTINGSLFSPGYPYDYPSNEDCSWRITAPFGQRVLIYFTSFELEGSGGSCSSCSCDSVYIHDGPYSWSSRLAKSCGSELPLPVYSSSNEMLVTFRSDTGITHRGFVANYSTLSSSTGCPSIDPGQRTGVIYSPNFPWNYPAYEECVWVITAPYGMNINLTFTSFDTEDTYDYVEVRDGGYSWSPKLANAGKLSGTFYSPFSVVSSGSFLRVLFHSDYGSSDTGFLAFYQTGLFPTPSPYTTQFPYWTTYSPVTGSACELYSDNRLTVESTQSIASPSYPNPLPYGVLNSYAYSTCTWRIETSGSKYLELTFDHMAISYCGGCKCGYVKVWEGTSSNGKLIGSYCSGSDSKASAEGNYMYIQYYASGRYDTFEATIRAKNNGVVVAVVVPLVVGIFLFGIIFIVVKCTKRTPVTGQLGSSQAQPGGIALQSLPPDPNLAPSQPAFEYQQATAPTGQLGSSQAQPGGIALQSLPPDPNLAPSQPPAFEYQQGQQATAPAEFVNYGNTVET